jgi:hypothetical protein
VSDLTIAEFLLARFAELEAKARAATEGPWTVAKTKKAECDELAILSGGSEIVGAGYEGGGVWDRTDADHIVAWDPDAVLADIDSKRRIVALASRSIYAPEEEFSAEVALAEDVLKLLAVRFAGHEDYRQEWAL